MFNPLPLMALGVVAFGYAGSIDRVNRSFDSLPEPDITVFAPATNLSIHDYIGRLPETVQDPLCEPKSAMTASLGDDFAETHQISWQDSEPVSLELWASDLMGTWTVLSIHQNGLACVSASGFGWEAGMNVTDVMPTVAASS
jgi:hypothetical protein